jgi:hypothetical protein
MSDGLLASPVEHDHPIRSILVMLETTVPSGSADSLAGAICIANGRVVRALPNSGIGLRHTESLTHRRPGSWTLPPPAGASSTALLWTLPSEPWTLPAAQIFVT